MLKTEQLKDRTILFLFFFLKIVMNCHLTVVDSSQSMTENLSLLC